MAAKSTFVSPPLKNDEIREWNRTQKSREQFDKRMTAQEAVAKFIHNEDYLAIGNFGHIRIPMAILYEMIRQGIKDINFSGHTACHDLDILLAGGCIKHIDIAYAFGHELRPLRSPIGDRLIKAGKLTTTEWSNGAIAWRYKAAAMGVSFIPFKVMLGTDTFEKSNCVTIKCPYTGDTYAAIPACYPDVAVIHVHRCDIYGNCQSEGTTMADADLVRAAKRTIITTEKIISNEEIRREPHRTMIPYYTVDAVVEQPYGSHPCEMPYLYWFDEYHIAEYLRATQNEDDLKRYLDKYVYGVKDFWEYLEKIGGMKRLYELEQISRLQKQPPYPW